MRAAEDPTTAEALGPAIDDFLVESNGNVGSAPIRASQEALPTRAPRELYERLVREYDEAQNTYVSAVRSHKTQEEFVRGAEEGSQ